MNILITGGTGFIGRALCKSLLDDRHGVTVLSRQTEQRVRELCGAVAVTRSLAEITDEARFDAVINLAGEGIADARWTARRKAVLHSSRIGLTRELVATLARLRVKPAVLLSGSAVGYYGDQVDLAVSESSQPHDEYTHRLCKEWEHEADQAKALGIRVCLLRTGLVVGRGGGFLSKMLPLFRMGLGGRIGDGRQWMSWIHLDDHIAIQKRLLDDIRLQGAFNLTAPQPVTNAEFAATLGNCLHRPARLPVPSSILKLAMGEMAGLLLSGQKVLPKSIQGSGYRFKFPTVRPALEDILLQKR